MCTSDPSSLLSYFIQRDGKLPANAAAELAAIPTQVRVIPHGERLEERHQEYLCLILTGMALRLTTGNEFDGPASALFVPGDFTNTNSLLLTYPEQSVVSHGPCKVMLVERTAILTLARRYSRVMQLLWLSTLREARVSHAWLTAAASLSAPKRVAHLLCELLARYERVGWAENATFQSPLIQKDLSRLLGYSVTHVNRSVTVLRNKGMLRWVRDEVRVLDRERLEEFCGFDARYLETPRQVPTLPSLRRSAATLRPRKPKETRTAETTAESIFFGM